MSDSLQKPLESKEPPLHSSQCRFSDGWQGVFIRSDAAAYYADRLRSLLGGQGELALEKVATHRLLDLLEHAGGLGNSPPVIEQNPPAQNPPAQHSLVKDAPGSLSAEPAQAEAARHWKELCRLLKQSHDTYTDAEHPAGLRANCYATSFFKGTRSMVAELHWSEASDGDQPDPGVGLGGGNR